MPKTVKVGFIGLIDANYIALRLFRTVSTLGGAKNRWRSILMDLCRLAADLDLCFVCGIGRAEVMFNNEHVIPDWILRRFDLYSRKITLPNGKQQIYGRYTLRCCTSCNELLGAQLETPVSQLFEAEIGATVQNLRSADPTLLYSWLCLIFIKLHLKDREFRADLDQRNPSPQIGDIYQQF